LSGASRRSSPALDPVEHRELSMSIHGAVGGDEAVEAISCWSPQLRERTSFPIDVVDLASLSVEFGISRST
jgi:hypothetical protein